MSILKENVLCEGKDKQKFFTFYFDDEKALTADINDYIDIIEKGIVEEKLQKYTHPPSIENIKIVKHHLKLYAKEKRQAQATRGVKNNSVLLSKLYQSIKNNNDFVCEILNNIQKLYWNKPPEYIDEYNVNGGTKSGKTLLWCFNKVMDNLKSLGVLYDQVNENINPDGLSTKIADGAISEDKVKRKLLGFK